MTDPFGPAIVVARASRSPMERAAAALDPDRYRIFCATYASMRVIDDYVDDRFLAMPAPDRAALRGDARTAVYGWRDGAIGALVAGAAGPEDAPFAETHAALAAAHAMARIDPDPWTRLAGAMMRDVEERPMADWDAFLAYAEGATAAPAAVFIEILALAEGAEGRLVSRLGGPAVARIRNSAILLYLVHIMRDLKNDAGKGPELLTVPASLFAELGTDAAGFAARAAAEPDLVAAAQAKVAAFAERFLLPALAELAALDEQLEPADAAVLRGLCTPYIERYERFHAAIG